MAKETTLDDLFLNTDKAYVFHILTEDETTAIDISTWALSFMIKTDQGNADATALVTKTIGSGIVVAGLYNATPGSNAQRATVTIVDTDTDTKAPGWKRWELKRTDDGFETVLAFGRVPFRRAVHKGS
jgi:hypothetical protein